MIKNFTITKNKFKKTEKQPDYRMSTKIGDEFVEIGSLWIKEDKNGGKYFSGKMNDIYVDHTKNIARKGFVIQQEGMTAHAQALPPMKDEDPNEIPF